MFMYESVERSPVSAMVRYLVKLSLMSKYFFLKFTKNMNNKKINTILIACYDIGICEIVFLNL